MTSTPSPQPPTDKPLSTEGQPTAPRAPSALQRWGVPLLIVLLLLVHVGLFFHCALEDSATFDEVGHLTAGLSYWQSDSFALYNVNPPLPKLLSTLPLLLSNPDTRAIRIPVSPGERPEWAVG